MKTYHKVLLIILGGAVFVTAAMQLYFSYSLDKQLKNIAVERFHIATDDAYELDIADVDLQIWGRELSLSDITLTKEQNVGTNIRLTLDNLSISGIGFLPLFLQKELRLNQIKLTNPSIYITSSPNSSDDQPKWVDPTQTISSIALYILDDINIPRIRIQGLSVDYNRADLPVNPYISIKESDITFYEVSIDSSTLKDDRIIPSAKIAATLRDIQYQTPNELYNLTVEKIAFSSSDSSINISTFAFKPKYDKKAFADRHEYEIDRIDLTVDHIQWSELQVQKLNRGQGISADHVAISTPDADIYRDKRPPFPPNNRPPLPQQMIRNIPFPISIDSITISDGNIRYGQRLPQADEPGWITFDNLSATLNNFSNIKSASTDSNMPTLSMQTNIMDQARLQANFKFPMENESNHQRITGKLGPMEMQPLNKALEPMAFVRINDGSILGLDFQMDLTSTKADGQVTFRYEDLNISLLDKETNEETFGKKVTSLLANTMKIKTNNNGKVPRIGDIDFERDQKKSVFNYWWKSLLSGLKSSIGL